MGADLLWRVRWTPEEESAHQDHWRVVIESAAVGSVHDRPGRSAKRKRDSAQPQKMSPPTNRRTNVAKEIDGFAWGGWRAGSGATRFEGASPSGAGPATAGRRTASRRWTR